MEHWKTKFRNAFRGMYLGSCAETSFWVHAFMSLAVITAAFVLRCELWQWCGLLLCMALVIAFELMNSALEYFAKGVVQEHNEDIRDALDIASGAVLAASIFAAVIGAIILGTQFLAVF